LVRQALPLVRSSQRPLLGCEPDPSKDVTLQLELIADILMKKVGEERNEEELATAQRRDQAEET
jgi:hypothetical protein